MMLKKHKWKLLIIAAAALFVGALPAMAQTAVGYYVRIKEQASASVATPPAGFQNLFIDSTAHGAYLKNSSGTSTAIGGSGSALPLSGGTMTGPIESATSLTLESTAASGSSNPATITNTTNAYTTTGDELASWQSNGTEEMRIVYNKYGLSEWMLQGTGADTGFINSTLTGIFTETNVLFFAEGGSAVAEVTSASLKPTNTLGLTLGAPTLLWQGTHSQFYGTGLGTQITAASTITPTYGLQHVTGATSISTIAATNFTGNTTWTAIADSATITFVTGGNIGAAVTITSGNMRSFVYDATATTWYPEQ